MFDAAGAIMVMPETKAGRCLQMADWGAATENMLAKFQLSVGISVDHYWATCVFAVAVIVIGAKFGFTANRKWDEQPVMLSDASGTAEELR